MVDCNIIGYARRSKKTNMQDFADADHVSDLVNQKSISRYIFIIYDNIMCFSSIK